MCAFINFQFRTYIHPASVIPSLSENIDENSKAIHSLSRNTHYILNAAIYTKEPNLFGTVNNSHSFCKSFSLHQFSTQLQRSKILSLNNAYRFPSNISIVRQCSYANPREKCVECSLTNAMMQKMYVKCMHNLLGTAYLKRVAKT